MRFTSDSTSLFGERPAFPLLLLILTVLQIIAGVGMIWVILKYSGQANDVMSNLGIPPIVVIAFFVLLAFTSLGAAIGTLLKQKWGWWLAVFYFACTIMRYLNTMIEIWGLEDTINMSAGEVEKAYLKFGLRTIIDSLVMYYYFSNTVFRFYGMDQSKKLAYFLKVLGAAVLTFVLTSVVAFLSR